MLAYIPYMDPMGNGHEIKFHDVSRDIKKIVEILKLIFPGCFINNFN